MKRIWAIFQRDVFNSTREFILIYMMAAPIILALILRLFIPSANSAALQFALDEKVGEEVIRKFEQYGNVEIYKDVEEIEKRVKGTDDIAGVLLDENGSYQIILEGNETHDTKVIPQMIIRDLVDQEDIAVKFSTRDIGHTRSPIARVGAVSLILTTFVLAGTIIGFNMIEEKDSKTLSALNVTPMRRSEFIMGKSIVGIVLPLIIVYFILWLLDMWYVDKAMVFAMLLSSSTITIITGFLIGVFSSNQIAGIANMKVLLLPLSASVIGALLLPSHRQFFLYWIPTYWSFIGFDEIIKNTATWGQIVSYSAWILGLIFLILLLLKNKIKRSFV